MIAEEPVEQRSAEKQSPTQGFELVEDHIELAMLELRFEAAAARQRLKALVGSMISALLALLCLQTALIAVLWRVGVPLYWGAGGCGLFWGVMMGLLYRYGGIRDPQAGAPFEDTRAELRRSWKWIQQNIS